MNEASPFDLESKAILERTVKRARETADQLARTFAARVGGDTYDATMRVRYRSVAETLRGHVHDLDDLLAAWARQDAEADREAALQAAKETVFGDDDDGPPLLPEPAQGESLPAYIRQVIDCLNDIGNANATWLACRLEWLARAAPTMVEFSKTGEGVAVVK